MDLKFRLALLEVLPGGEVRLSCLEVSSVVPARLHLPLVGKVGHLKCLYLYNLVSKLQLQLRTATNKNSKISFNPFIKT